MVYVYILEYDGKISTEGYDTIDKAINRIKNQGYYPINKDNWYHCTNGKYDVKIKEVKIV